MVCTCKDTWIFCIPVYAIKHSKHVATATAPLPGDVIFIAEIQISIILNFTYPVLMLNPNNLIVKTRKK